MATKVPAASPANQACYTRDVTNKSKGKIADVEAAAGERKMTTQSYKMEQRGQDQSQGTSADGTVRQWPQ